MNHDTAPHFPLHFIHSGADVPYHNSGIVTPPNNPFLRAYCTSPAKGVEGWSEIGASAGSKQDCLGRSYESLTVLALDGWRRMNMRNFTVDECRRRTAVLRPCPPRLRLPR